MAYITNADVIERIGTAAATQLTTDSGSSPDTTLIDKIIAEVEGTIDAYLRRRTATPVLQATHPQTYEAVQGKAMAMTVYQIMTRRPPVPEDAKDNNRAAIAWLEQLAKGEIDLPDEVLNPDRAAWDSEDPTGAGHDYMV